MIRCARRLTLGSLAATLTACCFASGPAPAGAPTRIEVRVPASVIAEHATQLPLLLLVAHTPGTLANRGLPLAKICDAEHDVVVAWDEPLESEVDLSAWIEPTYPGPPIPDCGPTAPAYREDLIAGPPEHFTHARTHVTPGEALTIEVR